MLTKLFGKPTKDEFAETICELAHSHGDFELTYDQERFRIVVGDPEEFTNQFNLGNVYEEYLSAGPLHRRALLKGYVSMLVDSPIEKIPDTFREAQASLVPRVRERSYHAIAKLQMAAEGEEYIEPAYRVLADHLLVELVYDLPESITDYARGMGRWTGYGARRCFAESSGRQSSEFRFSSAGCSRLGVA